MTRDINNPLIKAYYDVINALGYPVFEGEEPDDTLDKLYFVISDVSSQDASTDSSSDVTAQIQVTGNSWEFKYNNAKALNDACGDILQAIKTGSTAVLSLAASNMEMLNLSVTSDNTQSYGKLSGRVYISRNIIFNQTIFIH